MKTITEYKRFLRRHAVFKKFENEQKKNNKLKIDFHCKDLSCKRVYVRKLPHDHTAKLRVYEGQHTCKK